MAALLGLGGDAVTVQQARPGAATFMAVKSVTGWSNGLVITKDVVRAGCARFSFVMRRGRCVTLGVCNPQIRWDTYLNQTEHGWGLFAHSGRVGHHGSADTPYIPPDVSIQEGDEVAVEVNVDAGTVEFFVNGRGYGVAFRNLPPGRVFHGAFSLYHPGEAVEYRGMTRMDDALLRRPPPPQGVATLGQTIASSAMQQKPFSVVTPPAAASVVGGGGGGGGGAKAVRLLGSYPPPPAAAAAAAAAPTAAPGSAAGSPFRLRLPQGFWVEHCGSDVTLSGQSGRGQSGDSSGGDVLTVAACTAAQPSWSRKTAVARAGVAAGAATWHFEVLSPQSTHLTIGVLPLAPVRSPSGDIYHGNNRDGDFLNSASRGGWGFYQRNGCVGHGGPASAVYGKPYAQGDIVSVHLDCTTRTLAFSVNGVRLGPAFADLPAPPLSSPLHAAVSMRDPGDCVRLVAVELVDDAAAAHAARYPAAHAAHGAGGGAPSPTAAAAVTPQFARAAAVPVRAPVPAGTAVGVGAAAAAPQRRVQPLRPPKPATAAPAAPVEPRQQRQRQQQRPLQPTAAPTLASVALVWKHPSIVPKAGGGDRGGRGGARGAGTEAAAEAEDAAAPAPSLRWQKRVPAGQQPAWSTGLMLFRPLLQTSDGGTGSPGDDGDNDASPDDGSGSGGSGSGGGATFGGAYDADGDWQPGRQWWTFKIHAGTHASVGVARPGIDKHSFVNETRNGWALFQRDGKVGHGGPAQTEYLGLPVPPGSVVTVVADRVQRTLYFIVDGKHAGVAFADLPPREEVLYGAVSLYDHLAEVELVTPQVRAASAAAAKIAQFKLTQFLRELDRSCREYDNLSLTMLKHCRFKDLVVGAKIGGGCSGEVYTVHCRSDAARRGFAMKKLFDLAGASQAEEIKHQRDKFLRDFHVPVSLRSSDEALSHIVQCYTHLVAPTAKPTPVEKELGRGKTEYIIMEMCKRSLQNYLDDFYKAHGCSPPEHVLLLCVLQILRALAVLEERRILHRDLKLDNIMVKSGSDLELRLIDFGEALVDGRGEDIGGNSLNMAPEVLRLAAKRDAQRQAERARRRAEHPGHRGGSGRRLTGQAAVAAAAAAARRGDEQLDDAARQARFNAVAKTDVWALGCLLYAMVRQQHPFANTQWFQPMPATCDEEPATPDLTSSPPRRPPLLPDTYPRLDQLAGLFLRPDPARRPTARQATRVVGNLLWFPDVAPLPPRTFQPSQPAEWTAPPQARSAGDGGSGGGGGGSLALARAGSRASSSLRPPESFDGVPTLALVRAVRWGAEKFVAQLEARGQFQVVYVRCIADKLKAQHFVDMLRACEHVKDDGAKEGAGGGGAAGGGGGGGGGGRGVAGGAGAGMRR